MPTLCRTRRGRRVSAPFLDRHPDGVVIECWVVPGASRTEVAGVHGDALKVRVAAPPEGGRANDAVVGLLSELCGWPAELTRGVTSRSKTVLLRGASLSEVEQRLA